MKRTDQLNEIVRLVYKCSAADEELQTMIPRFSGSRGLRSIRAGVIGMLLVACHIMTKAGEAANVTPEQGACDMTGLAQQLKKRVERRIVYLNDVDIEDYTKALNEAACALSQARKIQGSPVMIDRALEQLEKGEPRAAELILAELAGREASQGKDGLKRAAEIQLHVGALARLHDAQAAWAAYSRAVAFDSQNADGWNRLGYCAMSCLHDWGEAEKAFQKLIDLGRVRNDPMMMALGYHNLGSIYTARQFISKAPFFKELKGTKGIPKEYNARDDRERAVAMHRKALQVYADNGDQERMAREYDRLIGALFGLAGEDEGKASHALSEAHKALDIRQALGRNIDTAVKYEQLGLSYEKRGDRDQATLSSTSC
ncbi:MAG: hypothetical protein ACREV4_02630 [Gammaproteobacteria bacterium]